MNDTANLIVSRVGKELVARCIHAAPAGEVGLTTPDAPDEEALHFTGLLLGCLRRAESMAVVVCRNFAAVCAAATELEVLLNRGCGLCVYTQTVRAEGFYIRVEYSVPSHDGGEVMPCVILVGVPAGYVGNVGLYIITIPIALDSIVRGNPNAAVVYALSQEDAAAHALL